MSMTVVIDAGHGGAERAGGSSPNNATGPNGLREKDKTYGLETMCVGGGQGMAMIVERLN